MSKKIVIALILSFLTLAVTQSALASAIVIGVVYFADEKFDG